ncbi:hypothetical protein J5Y03_02650 [Bacillus sp. RG28]|uniref:Uncharacterized protein n=1 Tax=Gottfriedia endophytica TaxID=2820819 RepID=A0A940SI32_9BACI|nr:hypothetical protein [Gottfriedia endophytica]MBP0724081.1 hypothetical protein [Gottfriedia endophytica]
MTKFSRLAAYPLKKAQIFQSKEFLEEFEKNLQNVETDIEKEIIEKPLILFLGL